MSRVLQITVDDALADWVENYASKLSLTTSSFARTILNAARESEVQQVHNASNSDKVTTFLANCPTPMSGYKGDR